MKKFLGILSIVLILACEKSNKEPAIECEAPSLECVRIVNCYRCGLQLDFLTKEQCEEAMYTWGGTVDQVIRRCQ